MGVDMPGVVVDGVDGLIFAAEIFLYEAGSSFHGGVLGDLIFFEG